MTWALDIGLAFAAILLHMTGSDVAAAPEVRPATPSSAPAGMTEDEIRDEMAVW